MNPSLRLSVRSGLVLVAVVAVGLAVWTSYLDPVRRWKRAVHDDNHGARRWEAGLRGINGQVPGVTSTMAIDELILSLGDPSPRVRDTSLNILLQTGKRSDPAIPSMILMLKDPDLTVRLAAVRTLGLLLPALPKRRPLILPRLVAMLKDPHLKTRQTAAYWLATLGEAKTALPVLIEELSEKDYLTRASAIWAIRQAGPDGKPAIEALRKMVEECESNPDPFQREQRIRGAALLITLGATDEGQRVLQNALNDEDPRLRQAAELAWKALGPH